MHDLSPDTVSNAVIGVALFVASIYGIVLWALIRKYSREEGNHDQEKE